MPGHPVALAKLGPRTPVLLLVDLPRGELRRDLLVLVELALETARRQDLHDPDGLSARVAQGVGYIARLEDVRAGRGDHDLAAYVARQLALQPVRARGEAIKRLEDDRDALMESYTGAVKETLGDLAPEERHRIYKLLRLSVRFRPDWLLEVSGIFAEVAEEAENNLSYCKLSSLSV